MINNQPLIRSSESLRNISKTLTSFSKSLNTSTLLARDIAKTIQASNVEKKKIISKEQTFFVKRRESFLRKRREGLIEASGIKGALRSTGNTIKNTAKGFLGRLLSFIGIVFLGWIVLNVPKIIKAIQGIIKRITDVTSIMGNWVSGLREKLTNFGEATQKVLSDITGIDFSPEERSIQSGFDQSNRSLSKIDQDVVNDTNALQEPKTYGLEESDLKPEKNEVPETQEDANKWYQNFMTRSKRRDTSPSTQQGDASSSRTMTATPELYRIAAAMVTEGAGGTATTDIMQVLANRKASGRYTGYKGDNSYTGLLAADGQFEGVYSRGQDRFVAIQTAEEAAEFANTTVEEIQSRIDDLTNPQYAKNSAEFIKGAMEFRGSPTTVRAVNTDNDPNNNIEEIGTTGRIPESIWRGGDGDNQFLIGPKDATRPEGAAPYNFDSNVSSTYEKTFTYTGKKTMPKVKSDKNGPVIVLQQQSQPNTQPIIMASSSSEESIVPFIASGADSLYIKLAALHAAYT